MGLVRNESKCSSSKMQWHVDKIWAANEERQFNKTHDLGVWAKWVCVCVGEMRFRGKHSMIWRWKRLWCCCCWCCCCCHLPWCKCIVQTIRDADTKTESTHSYWKNEKNRMDKKTNCSPNGCHFVQITRNKKAKGLNVFAKRCIFAMTKRERERRKNRGEYAMSKWMFVDCASACTILNSWRMHYRLLCLLNWIPRQKPRFTASILILSFSIFLSSFLSFFFSLQIVMAFARLVHLVFFFSAVLSCHFTSINVYVCHPNVLMVSWVHIIFASFIFN